MFTGEVTAAELARIVLELRARALRERHRGVRVRVVRLRDGGGGLEAEDGAWLVRGTAGEVEQAVDGRDGAGTARPPPRSGPR